MRLLIGSYVTHITESFEPECRMKLKLFKFLSKIRWQAWEESTRYTALLFTSRVHTSVLYSGSMVAYPYS